MKVQDANEENHRNGSTCRDLNKTTVAKGSFVSGAWQRRQLRGDLTLGCVIVMVRGGDREAL